MPDPRTLDYRCAFIIEAYDQPVRFHRDVDLQAMLGKRQPKPNKAQVDRARRYRAHQTWPTTCGNSKGRGGIPPHVALASGWPSALGPEHFYEPWHYFCKKCDDADADAQGDGRWQPDEGAKPPASWRIGEPYRGLNTPSRAATTAAAAQSAMDDAAQDQVAHGYALRLVRQALEREGDVVEAPQDDEPFDLRAIGRDGDRFVFVRVGGDAAAGQAAQAFAAAHAGRCVVALVEGITVKRLASGPQALGGRVAALRPWSA